MATCSQLGRKVTAPGEVIIRRRAADSSWKIDFASIERCAEVFNRIVGKFITKVGVNSAGVNVIFQFHSVGAGCFCYEKLRNELAGHIGTRTRVMLRAIQTIVRSRRAQARKCGRRYRRDRQQESDLPGRRAAASRTNSYPMWPTLKGFANCRTRIRQRDPVCRSGW